MALPPGYDWSPPVPGVADWDNLMPAFKMKHHSDMLAEQAANPPAALPSLMAPAGQLAPQPEAGQSLMGAGSVAPPSNDLSRYQGLLGEAREAFDNAKRRNASADVLEDLSRQVKIFRNKVDFFSQ